MPVDFIAGETHFLDHLHPIWAALPETARGEICLVRTGSDSNPLAQLDCHAQYRRFEGCHRFLTPGKALNWLQRRAGPVVTASYRDAKLAQRVGRPQVFCEHGAGQSYGGEHNSYSGGRGARRNVRLFLCPNQGCAERNQEAFPDAEVAVIGCPKLDHWHQMPPLPRRQPPIVAISFHWDCAVVMETRSALPFFRPALPALAERWMVLGHGHPRIMERLLPIYDALDIEPVYDFEEVLERADCYVCDNSSTMFEFASTGRPVVVLNPPWYRREVNHGLRFWEAAGVGVNCDRPQDLAGAVATALQDPPHQREARRQAVSIAYGYTDGRAAQRAALAILELT
jgi:hypothetical protein